MPSRQRPGAEDEALNALGARIAESLNVPVACVRYAMYRFHNGKSWTIRACWERKTRDGWREISHDEVPDSYRAP